MTLPYSGVTTAYFHKHHPDQPLPTADRAGEVAADMAALRKALVA